MNKESEKNSTEYSSKRVMKEGDERYESMSLKNNKQMQTSYANNTSDRGNQ